MAFSNVDATASTVVSAQAEQTFDKWKLMRLNCEDRNGSLKVVANFRKARVDGNDWVLAPLEPANRATVRISDLSAVSSQDQDLEDAINVLISRLKLMGDAQGVL